MICLNRRANHMNRNTIPADQRTIHMRRRVIHMSRERLFPGGNRIRCGWTPPGVVRAGNNRSGAGQTLTGSPNLLTGFVRSCTGFSETGTVWSGPGKGLGKSCTAFGETVTVWAKRCQFLRKPVQVSRGGGRDLSKAGTWPAKQVHFRGKAAPNRGEDATSWANASPFSENRYSFLA
jgi:hypothetical protein